MKQVEASFEIHKPGIEINKFKESLLPIPIKIKMHLNIYQSIKKEIYSCKGTFFVCLVSERRKANHLARLTRFCFGVVNRNNLIKKSKLGFQKCLSNK